MTVSSHTVPGSGDDTVDVVIAGGGLVGAALAVALVDSGLHVRLIEPTGLTPADPAQDTRATALSESSSRFFEALGLWDCLAEQSEPIRQIHVSERGRFGRLRMHAREVGLEALGQVVPNPLMEAALGNFLQSAKRVSCVADRVTSVAAPQAEWRRVMLESGGVLHTRLLVVADGAASPLRDQLEIAASRRDFRQHALVADVATQTALVGRAWERFTDQGPMALLPRGGNWGNLVLCVAPDEVDHWREMPDGPFLSACRERFGGHLGNWQQVGPRQVFPLRQVQARELVRERAVLIGNAAMALHPVAGQGFNLALRGVADLAETLIESAGRGEDPGAADRLSRHARRRERDIAFTSGWTRALAEGFVLDWPGVGMLRSKALWSMDRLPLARTWLTRRGTGMVPHLPALCRGVRPRG